MKTQAFGRAAPELRVSYYVAHETSKQHYERVYGSQKSAYLRQAGDVIYAHAYATQQVICVIRLAFSGKACVARAWLQKQIGNRIGQMTIWCLQSGRVLISFLPAGIKEGPLETRCLKIMITKACLFSAYPVKVFLGRGDQSFAQEVMVKTYTCTFEQAKPYRHGCPGQ